MQVFSPNPSTKSWLLCPRGRHEWEEISQGAGPLGVGNWPTEPGLATAAIQRRQLQKRYGYICGPFWRKRQRSAVCGRDARPKRDNWHRANWLLFKGWNIYVDGSSCISAIVIGVDYCEVNLLNNTGIFQFPAGLLRNEKQALNEAKNV